MSKLDATGRRGRFTGLYGVSTQGALSGRLVHGQEFGALAVGAVGSKRAFEFQLRGGAVRPRPR
jgi:hypothetical protein